jgi:hypothetical protein
MNKNELKEMLSKGYHTVTFTKVDGATRVMECTLKPEQIPADQAPKEMGITAITQRKTENPNVLAVYEANKGWRSFRVDSVQSIV